MLNVAFVRFRYTLTLLMGTRLFLWGRLDIKCQIQKILNFQTEYEQIGLLSNRKRAKHGLSNAMTYLTCHQQKKARNQSPSTHINH